MLRLSVFLDVSVNALIGLFYTEARAAFKAGYTTAVSVRPGNAALTDMDKKDFATISTFSELFVGTEERPHRTKKSKRDDC